MLQMNASRSFGDYHRILAPGESYEGKLYFPYLFHLFQAHTILYCTLYHANELTNLGINHQAILLSFLFTY